MPTVALRVVEQTAPPPAQKSLLDILFGRPLSSDEDVREKIGPVEGIPVFGLDALSSTAYGPEAALTVLLPLGIAGVAYILPISLTIIVLLCAVYFSYRQTIAAYPGGAGSYTVATANLGRGAGLLAGASLMLDYILNVAVGISAGVGATVSAVPALQPHTLALCLGILLLLTLVNLRGVHEAGLVFMAPTYLFVFCLGGVIVFGIVRALVYGHPTPAAAIPKPGPATATISIWLLAKAFASGCTAMTGVEAVSNGLQAFREPRARNGRRTLTIIILILLMVLVGIAWLCRAYGIAATPPGQPGYQSLLSEVTAAVSGRNIFYFVTMAAILMVLSLSANTSFADFPRLCRAIAEDGYLPYPFTLRGRRLVFSFGVYVLAILSAVLLIVFKGVTDRLIPLFAVGAFMAFTLSQAGMVMHWRTHGGRGARSSILINGLGALATGLTTCVVLVAKFVEGAWITALAIPGIILLMSAVRRHYETIERETRHPRPAHLNGIAPPMVVLPLQRWSRVAEKALRFAYTLSHEIRVLHIAPDDEPGQAGTDELRSVWNRYIELPAQQAGLPRPELVILHSPYRLVMTPIFEYILDLERQHPKRTIAVLVPELVERRWYYYLLHNQRATALKLILYVRGNGRIVMINVPWYLRA
ncbi:MAG TPA: APC family permease [Candidatus Angelobacter sp.]|nr:APC family permease [Candidatus Angelobacter sp.]